MIDESWKKEYKEWKDLKPYQIQLIDEGPKSQSQAWLLNYMWCEWKDLKQKINTQSSLQNKYFNIDPWEV